MLNELKNRIEQNNFSNFINIELKYDELIVSAEKYIGYVSIKELVTISELINTDIYSVEYLNDNIIKIKVT